MAAAAPKTQMRTRAPYANLFDIPELMPGAQPSCTPAQREEFEQRCRQLHQEEVRAERASMASRAESRATESELAMAELEAMFPNIDPGLVRSLAAELPSPQHAIEMLLMLAATMADADGGDESHRTPAPEPLDLGVESLERFPSLLDTQGWQVRSHSREQEPGCEWRDRAQAARHIAAPKKSASSSQVSLEKPRRKPKKSMELDHEPQQFQTDYEWRLLAGQRRAQRRQSKAEAKARAKVGPSSPAALRSGESSESEASVELEALPGSGWRREDD